MSGGRKLSHVDVRLHRGYARIHVVKSLLAGSAQLKFTHANGLGNIPISSRAQQDSARGAVISGPVPAARDTAMAVVSTGSHFNCDNRGTERDPNEAP